MGKRIAAKITGVGGYVPPQVLTNADIAKLVDTDDQWIRERTGISERHIVEPGVATSHLATAAAQTVLEKTHTAPEEIDLIIVATPFGKTKTISQMLAVALLMLQRPYPALDGPAKFTVWAAVIFTIFSGLDYLWRYRRLLYR